MPWIVHWIVHCFWRYAQSWYRFCAAIWQLNGFQNAQNTLRKNEIGYDRIFFTHHTTAWGLCDACFDRYNTTCVRCNETIPDDELLLGCPWAGKPCSRILNKRSYSHAVTETTGKPQIAIRGDIRLVCAIFATRLECKHIGSAQEWTWFAWQDCHKKCTRPSTRKWQQFGNRQDQACFVCVFFQWLLPLDRSSVGCQKKIPLKQLRWGSGLCDTCYNKSSHFESMKMEFDLNMAKPVPLFLICCLAFTSCELDKFWFPRDYTSGMSCRMCNTAISTLPGLRRDLELKRAWIRKSQITIFEYCRTLQTTAVEEAFLTGSEERLPYMTYMT